MIDPEVARSSPEPTPAGDRQDQPKVVPILHFFIAISQTCIAKIQWALRKRMIYLRARFVKRIVPVPFGVGSTAIGIIEGE